ncbi:hypothetical protein M3Y94_00800700 [Aphelenchoides besseyi]|nr:hypothetical protein M3Y94_00800700 [Aphelenchoides besseyi]
MFSLDVVSDAKEETIDGNENEEKVRLISIHLADQLNLSQSYRPIKQVVLELLGRIQQHEVKFAKTSTQFYRRGAKVDASIGLSVQAITSERMLLCRMQMKTEKIVRNQKQMRKVAIERDKSINLPELNWDPLEMKQLELELMRTELLDMDDALRQAIERGIYLLEVKRKALDLHSDGADGVDPNKAVVKIQAFSALIDILHNNFYITDPFDELNKTTTAKSVSDQKLHSKSKNSNREVEAALNRLMGAEIAVLGYDDEKTRPLDEMISYEVECRVTGEIFFFDLRNILYMLIVMPSILFPWSALHVKRNIVLLTGQNGSGKHSWINGMAQKVGAVRITLNNKTLAKKTKNEDNQRNQTELIADDLSRRQEESKLSKIPQHLTELSRTTKSMSCADTLETIGKKCSRKR